MKITLKKLLISLILVVMLSNYLLSNVTFVYAEENDDELIVGESWLGGIASSVVGLLTLPIRIIAVYIGKAINFVTALVAYAEFPEDGNNDSDGKGSTINPFDILFNKVGILDINFFKIDDSDTIVNTIRKGVAGWYYVMRLIATSILLVILVYVGIRMAISTVASEKATYKKMLFDWAMSLAIIYLLHYIIIFVININDALVNTIGAASGTESGKISEAIEVIFNLSKEWVNINSLPATVVYLMLCWQTLGLLISYFSRMLKLAFLLIIAPLITITYSIDKMGDGKAQVLERWLKEFIYTILIQPFHCIIYLTLVSTSFNLMVKYKNNTSPTRLLAAGILSILCIKFIKEAEHLVRTIFNFQDDNNHTSLAAGAATAAMAVKYSKSIGATAGRAAGKGVTALRNAPGNVKNGLLDMRANIHAIRSIGSSGGKSFSERKDEFYSDYSSRAEEREKALEDAERYSGMPEAKMTANKEKRSKEVAERTKELMDSKGYNLAKASAIARNEVSKRHYANQKAGPVKKGIKRTISKASGKYHKVRNVALDIGRNSQVLQSIGKYAKFSAAAATGVVTGTGLYSGNKDLFTSIGAGIMAHNATNSGMDEFYKSTMGYFAGNARSSMKSLGITNNADARAALTRIMANGDKYGNEDELKDLVDAIKAELTKLGRSESEAVTIQHQIETEIANGRSVNPEQLVARMFGNGAEVDGLKNATRKLSNFENERNIYNLSQQATDLGISGDRFVSSTVSSMTDSDYRDARSYAPVRPRNTSLGQKAEEGTVDRSEVAPLSLEEKEALSAEVGRMLDSAKRELDGYEARGIDNKTLEDTVNRLQQNKDNIDIELNAASLAREVATARKQLSDEEAASILNETIDREAFERQLQEEYKRMIKDFATMQKNLERQRDKLTAEQEANQRQAIVEAQNQLSILSQNMETVKKQS